MDTEPTSIIALTATAIQWSKGVLTFAGNLRSAPKDIQETLRRLETCRATLEEIQRVLEKNETSSRSSTGQDTEALRKELAEFRKTCRKLKPRLKPFHGSDGIVRKSVWARLRWRMSKETFKSIDGAVQRHQNSLSFLLLNEVREVTGEISEATKDIPEAIRVTTETGQDARELKKILVDLTHILIGRGGASSVLSDEDRSEVDGKIEYLLKWREQVVARRASYIALSDIHSIPDSLPNPLPAQSSLSPLQLPNLDAVVSPTPDHTHRSAAERKDSIHNKHRDQAAYCAAAERQAVPPQGDRPMNLAVPPREVRRTRTSSELTTARKVSNAAGYTGRSERISSESITAEKIANGTGRIGRPEAKKDEQMFPRPRNPKEHRQVEREAEPPKDAGDVGSSWVTEMNRQVPNLIVLSRTDG
jgi:hypothetical protein